MNDTKQKNWLLLIHQIPPKPDYFRVKIWRRLQKVGAAKVKQSVYVLPDTEQAYEDFLWIVKEIDQGGGTASLSRTLFLEGLSDVRIKGLFHDARNDDYAKIVEGGKRISEDFLEVSQGDAAIAAEKLHKELSRLQHRMDEIAALDFFHAPGRRAARNMLQECSALLDNSGDTVVSSTMRPSDMHGKTWVTRTGLYVDRIACAWLIKRFIDPAAAFKYVENEKYAPKSGEIRFDMSDAEFTHQGDKCSFEVLVKTFALSAVAVMDIAEIVHDIDLKDNKYARPETVGIQSLFSGMAITCMDDSQRLERGVTILDELYACFQKRYDNLGN